MSITITTQKLTEAQRDALLAAMASRYGGRLVLSQGGAANLRTVRKLAEYGLATLHEGYSRSHAGNTWMATLTERGQQVREQLTAEATR